MNRNNFQKNLFVNNNSTSGIKGVNKLSDYEQLGRKTVEEVKKNMADVKYNHLQKKIDNNKKSEPRQESNSIPNFKQRVDVLKRINRG